MKAVASSCDNPKTRLKLLNTGAAARFNVSIDGYRMIVVAADGVSVDPVEVRSEIFVIGSGSGNVNLVAMRGQITSGHCTP